MFHPHNSKIILKSVLCDQLSFSTGNLVEHNRNNHSRVRRYEISKHVICYVLKMYYPAWSATSLLIMNSAWHWGKIREKKYFESCLIYMLRYVKHLCTHTDKESQYLGVCCRFLSQEGCLVTILGLQIRMVQA